MPTTSNFGWTTPADTDLVKDGALAIRTLGNGIDTSMMDLKGGTTGQVLSKASNTDMDFTWVTSAGDIEGVTAGTGISGGGTSGTVTITNSMATTIDAKGDLVAGTANDTFARLAVGNNGETLVADSSATTGLRWQGNFAAGKNKIINGDFNINQRNFSSSTTTGAYNFDRWQQVFSGGSQTITPQTFTTGTAPVAGYESKTFCRIVSASQSAAGDYSAQTQKIEGVRTFAGQTVTVSFWAKASTGTPNIGLSGLQNFGTGGSPSSNVIVTGSTTAITTSWARYSFTLNVPSISGKTIGSNNDDHFRVDLWTSAGTTISGLGYPAVGVQNVTIDVWGFQAEAGSVATAFQTATGTLAGELAACQRYYWQIIDGSVTNAMVCNANSYTTTDCRGVLQYPVTMRTAPTLVQTSSTNYWQYQAAASDSFDALTITSTSTNTTLIYGSAGVNGLTAGQGGTIFSNNSAARLALSAEL